jgi:hypothetical protein
MTDPLPARSGWRRPRRGQGQAQGRAFGPALTPAAGGRPNRSYREQAEGSRSANFRSPRFEGIAGTLKTHLELRPVYHRLEHRIRAHVLLCWLALLLIRIIENATGTTWARAREDL